MNSCKKIKKFRTRSGNKIIFSKVQYKQVYSHSNILVIFWFRSCPSRFFIYQAETTKFVNEQHRSDSFEMAAL